MCLDADADASNCQARLRLDYARVSVSRGRRAAARPRELRGRRAEATPRAVTETGGPPRIPRFVRHGKGHAQGSRQAGDKSQGLAVDREAGPVCYCLGWTVQLANEGAFWYEGVRGCAS